MESEMRWTLETYRLDEVARKFDLPCVVSVNEGYYSETESEGFSQGDIISIDSRMVLHKVAANFAEDLSLHPSEDNDGYVELTDEKEILVPLNYRGKLKVLRHIKNFNSVRELAIEFPRYAKLRTNLTVDTEEKKKMTIPAGTVIELDRTLPGTSGGGQGKLVIQFNYMRRPTVVGLPMNQRGQFRTEPDETHYTIKEAIDRYSLPQHVRFVDDEIKRVYTQDLVDGIENMKTITETLRLNRLVTQEVLVAHYKPIEGAENTDSERFRQRTLVVLPTDNPEIRDIEVNVLLGITEDIYSDVFLVRNVSKTEEIVDGSLYVDFVMSPGIKRISEIDEGNTTAVGSTATTSEGITPVQEEDIEDAPPVPPRRGRTNQPPAAKSKPKHPARQKPSTTDATDDTYEDMSPSSAVKPPPKRQVQRKPSIDDDDESYEDMSAPVSPGSGLDFTLAGLKFDDSEKASKLTDKKKAVQNVLGNIFQKKKVAKVHPKKDDERPTALCPQDNSNTEQAYVMYDEVDEVKMLRAETARYDTPPHQRLVKNTSTTNRRDPSIPVARVVPTTNQKDFLELTAQELAERLNNANLSAMASFCHKEHLNGPFFQNMSKEKIKDTFSLNGIELLKFMKMKDENWIPPP